MHAYASPGLDRGNEAHPCGDIAQAWYGRRPGASPPCAAVALGPRTVVIVDDHGAFRRTARDLLRMRGYAVVGEAACAATAYDIVERVAPDAVLLDVNLGGENGFDVARALTRRHPGLAVLLMSADPYHAESGRVRASGARGFLSKSQFVDADLVGVWDPT